ncbi:FecCD family ABC transporter permease [Chloroflexota bacterium]
MISDNISSSKRKVKGIVRSNSGLSVIIVAALLLLVLFFLSFALGRYQISPIEVIKVLLSRVIPIEQTWPDMVETVMLQIRLPRILAAILIGGGLAISGASFQGIFRNPLVSPDILGVAAGAGFGAALGIIVWNGDPFMVQVVAFAFSLIAVAISYTVSKVVRSNPTLTLILAGMAIAALFSAFLSFLKYMADPFDQLPAIVFWMMGSLSAVDNADLLMVIGPMLVGIIILILIRWRLNILAMGEEEALSLGVETKKMQGLVIVCSTMVTASAVCISGVIGWVGLIIPHIGRMLVGPDHKKLLPVSLILGAFYLLLIDTVTRTAFSVEIPVGILTAIVGVPFFIYLLSRGRRGWL